MAGHGLGWVLAMLSIVVAVVSLARLPTARGPVRYAVGVELLMAAGMVIMTLPTTAARFGEYALWWAVIFAVVCTGSIAISVRAALRRGWRHGGHWVHQVIGSGVMTLMALAAVPHGAVGSALAMGMQGMHDHGGGETHAHHTTMAHTQGGGGSAWRVVFLVLALYFVLSMAASAWAWLRSTDRQQRPQEDRLALPWSHRLLMTVDTVIAFLMYLAQSAWTRKQQQVGQTAIKAGGHGEGDRAAAGRGAHRKAPQLATPAGAAFTAHLAMGGSMSTMLLMMAA